MNRPQPASGDTPTMTGVETLARQLLQLADAIEAGRSDEAIGGLLRESQAVCQAASTEGAAGTKTLLTNFLQALQTWQRVWGEMGRRQEFRHAVIREARAWANRLAKLGKG